MRPGRWTLTGRGQAAFPVPVANVAGNNLPGFTGAMDRPSLGAPGPYTGGNVGGTGDNVFGADPRADPVQPYPHRFAPNWSKDGPDQSRPDHPSYGFNGYNDKLTVKDRHAYWDTGNQKTGTNFQSGWAGAPPGTGNDPIGQPPRPDLRLVNRTVSYQQGTDTTRNQDDLTRPYTWLGEQGSGWIKINGGVPGLYIPYGSRGGIPYPVVSPVEQGQPGDGPHLVWSGPPHGLHSTTPWKGGAQIIARFSVIPQTRPVRQDRPSNSPQAGQSYSQTVLPQGASPVRPPRGRAGQTGPAPAGGMMFPGGRGWAGRTYKTGQGGI
jgi:hypothetical protein